MPCRPASASLMFALLLLSFVPTATASAWWQPGPPTPNSSPRLVTLNLIPNDFSAAHNNSQLLGSALSTATPGTTIFIPDSTDHTPYWLVGGNQFANLHNVTLQLQGELRAVTNCYDGCWPQDTGKNKLPFLHFFLFSNSTHLRIHGSGRIDGSGKGWWNRYVFGNHSHSKRPKLFVFQNVTDLQISNLTFINSPSFNLLLNPVLRVEISHVTVVTDRKVVRRLKATLSQRRRLTGTTTAGLQPEDLNTDGIDPSGKDIWIHDCSIQNDDDSIAVKPLSNVIIGSDNTHLTCCENILIENTMLTGFGASIGSVPPHADHNCVRNITFRNISMPGTGKGIYIKSNPLCDGSTKTAEITDILYEDITIEKPVWWPIWIGPQQQQEPGSALGRKCALQFPFLKSQCPTQGCVAFRNITLRRVTVTDSLFSPGVVLGNATNPMQGIVFEDVVVVRSGILPYGKKYLCKHAVGVAKGSTSPVPSCFTKE